MKILSNNLIRKILSVFVVCSLFMSHVLVSYVGKVSSGSLDTFSDTMTRQKISETSSHTFVFDLAATSEWTGDESITIDFGEDSSVFTVDGASTVAADFDIVWDDGGTLNATGTIVDVSTSAFDCSSSSGTRDVAVFIDDTTGIVTFEACHTTNGGSGAFNETESGATIQIDYGSSASGGSNRVTNPATADTYDIALTASPESENDTGTISQAILNDDQVVVSATVNPSLSVSLSSNTCNLGVLTTSQVDSCNYNIDVDTNSTNGYQATLIEDGNLRTGGGDDIDDESGSETIVAGTEEYGVGSSDDTVSGGSGEFPTYSDCNDPVSSAVAGAVTGSAKIVARDTTSGNEVSTVCHMATIGSGTSTGSYSHIVTVIVTALY